jgi:hypothetical protein
VTSEFSCQQRETPLLIRPPPQPGESLSSWRLRTGRANGYFMMPVPDERTRRSDADLGVSMKDIGWVAAMHGATHEQVIGTTLRSLIGVVVSDLGPRSQPSWWLRSRYGKSEQTYGPMFCPQCLAGDATPYFRLEWRLGFVAHCSVHQVLLIDQCPCCGSAPWPSGCGIRSRTHHRFTSLRFCWHCGVDLCALDSVNVSLCKSFLDWLDLEVVPLGVMNAEKHEALQALRAVCQLFLRRRSRAAIKRSKSRWLSLMGSLTPNAEHAQAVEHLKVDDRLVLLNAADEILKGWPSSFEQFAHEAGITREHFSGAEGLQPEWMTSYIDQHLALQNRQVTVSLLNATVEVMKAELGRMPSKTEVRKKLRWQGEKGLEELYPRRLHATRQELFDFLAAAETMMDRGKKSLKGHGERVFDLVFILVSMISVEVEALISAYTRQQLANELNNARRHGALLDPGLYGLLNRLSLEVDLVLSRRGVAFSTTRPAARQTGRRLRYLMTGLPSELVRNVSVFMGCCRLR